MNARTVKSIDKANSFAGSVTKSARRNGIRGMSPTPTNDIKVMNACVKDFFSFALSFDSSERKSADAIENPSEARFAHPRMMMIRGSSPAPAAPAITENVVTAPSDPPYTIAGRISLNFFIFYSIYRVMLLKELSNLGLTPPPALSHENYLADRDGASRGDFLAKKYTV